MSEHSRDCTGPAVGSLRLTKPFPSGWTARLSPVFLFSVTVADEHGHPCLPAHPCSPQDRFLMWKLGARGVSGAKTGHAARSLILTLQSQREKPQGSASLLKAGPWFLLGLVSNLMTGSSNRTSLSGWAIQSTARTWRHGAREQHLCFLLEWCSQVTSTS